MLTGVTPFAPSWTPPTQPSQPPTWPGRWDPATPVQAFNNMGVTPPVRTECIANSWASFHSTPDASILSYVRSLHPSIMVGDGSCLPVTSVGSAPGPFHLPDVLVAPQMIHNVLSIRQFTADNSEFDPSGFTVKDSAPGRPLLRYDSSGPLYALCLLASAIPPSTSATLATTPSSSTWHCRLGHLGLTSVVVHIFLALGLLVSISAMRASWVAMFAFRFLLLRMRCMCHTRPNLDGP
jgi:hypothetical protein